MFHGDEGSSTREHKFKVTDHSRGNKNNFFTPRVGTRISLPLRVIESQ